MSKSIVVYYSWSGNTRKIAQLISQFSGAQLLEIRPVKPYPANYNQLVAQARTEIQQGLRPAIEKVECDWDRFDTVYVGTPIWCGTMAPPLATFLEAQNFALKKVMPFCTHGGGGKGNAHKDLEMLCNGAKFMEMCEIRQSGGADVGQQIAQWIERCGIKN